MSDKPETPETKPSPAGPERKKISLQTVGITVGIVGGLIGAITKWPDLVKLFSADPPVVVVPPPPARKNLALEVLVTAPGTAQFPHGATVRLCDVRGTIDLTKATDPNGSFTFNLPDSLHKYKAWALHDGFAASDVKWIELAKDTSLTLALRANTPPLAPAPGSATPPPALDTIWMGNQPTGAYAVRYWVEGGTDADLPKILQRRDTLRTRGFRDNVGIFPSTETQELMLYGYWTADQAKGAQDRLIALNNRIGGTQNSLIVIAKLTDRCGGRRYFLNTNGHWQCEGVPLPPPQAANDRPVVEVPSSGTIQRVEDSGLNRGTKSKEAWFKPGYFLMFGEYKVLLQEMKNEQIAVRIDRIDRNGEIRTIEQKARIKVGGDLLFSDRDHRYRINFEKIDDAGINRFRKAAYITFETLN